MTTQIRPWYVLFRHDGNINWHSFSNHTIIVLWLIKHFILSSEQLLVIFPVYLLQTWLQFLHVCEMDFGLRAFIVLEEIHHITAGLCLNVEILKPLPVSYCFVWGSSRTVKMVLLLLIINMPALQAIVTADLFSFSKYGNFLQKSFHLDVHCRNDKFKGLCSIQEYSCSWAYKYTLSSQTVHRTLYII